MKRILFVCLGNICRSPMAEFTMKKLVRQAGREKDFTIASAGTSSEELGNPVYPMARQELAMHGIGCSGHTARQLTPNDYQRYDLIVAMDSANLRDVLRIVGDDPDGKVRLLLEGHDIADPWYTRDFRTAWREINDGCTALLQQLTTHGRTTD